MSRQKLGGMEESEIVDSLLQILVECVKMVDIRGQEILLRKFFFEVEKDLQLERFLIERLKQSKISSLVDQNLLRPATAAAPAAESSSRELSVDVAEAEEEKQKLERFKIKTVQLGIVVEEEKAR